MAIIRTQLTQSIKNEILEKHAIVNRLKTELQYNYYASLKVLLSLSRVFNYFKEYEEKNPRHLVFEVFELEGEALHAPWDYLHLIKFPLDKNFMPYVNKPSDYKVFLATDRAMLKKATILWISQEDIACAEFVVYESEFLCLLTDKYFRLLALVEWELPHYFYEQKKQYIESKQIVELDSNEELIDLGGKIGKVENVFFGLILGLKNIDLTALIAYGLHNNIIASDFVFDFIQYLKIYNFDLFDSLGLQRISVLQKKTDQGVANIYEEVWNFLKVLTDLSAEHFINITKYSNFLSSQTQVQNYCSIVDEKQFEIISLLENIDIYKLLYFGLRNGGIKYGQFVSDYAVYILLKDSTIEDQMILDLAGLTKHELHELDDILSQGVKSFGEKLWDNTLIYNKIWYFLHLVVQLAKQGAL